MKTPILAVLLAHLAASSASAATYYWDTDGSTAGFGDQAGTWGVDSFWSTNLTGGASTVWTDTTTTNDLVNFAGTSGRALGATAASVAVSGTVEAGRITFGVAQPAAVPVVLTGGTIKLGGTNAVPHIAPNSTNATINSALVLDAPTVRINGPNGGSGGVGMTLNLNGAISGEAHVTFFGPSGNNNFSTIFLGAQSTYTGGTTLHTSGTGANIGLVLGIDDALPTTTVLTLDGPNGSGTAAGRYVRVDLNGHSQTLAGLTTVVRGSRRDQGIINSSATFATLTVHNAADYTYTGQLGSGGQTATYAPNFGLTKDGVGRLTLDPRNLDGSSAVLNLKFTGPTTIHDGILEIANNGQLGNGNYAANIFIAGTGGLVFSGTRANVLSGILSGEGGLTNSGSGTVTISGTDALASTVVETGGVMAIGGGTVRSLVVGDAGTLNLQSGTVTSLTFVGTGTMNFNVAEGATLSCPVADGITNNGAAGTIVINITGARPDPGTYTLISYAGGLRGSGFSAYQLGATPGGAGYTLNDTGSAVRLIVSPAFVWTGLQSSEWSTNAIGGSMNWTWQGQPADFTNGLAALFDDTVPAPFNTLVDISVADVEPASVSFENGGFGYTLQGSKAIAGSASLRKIGAGTVLILNNNTYTGPTLIGSGGIVQVGNGGTSGALGSGAISDDGALQFNRSDAITLANGIRGSGSVEQNGSGTLTLLGANTYSGATTVNAGALRLGAADVLPNGSSVTVNGLLDMNTFSETIGGLSGSGTVDTVAGGVPTLTIGGGTFDGVIQNTAGTLGLAKTGSGTLTLSGSNTYSGGTTIAGGGVTANHDSALGTGPVVLDGGTRLLVGGGLAIDNPITIGNTIGVAGRGLIEPVDGQATIRGPINIIGTSTAGGDFASLGTGTLEVAGPIASSRSISARIGTVVLSGGGTGYTNLVAAQGTVRIGTNDGIATTAHMDIGQSGAASLDLNGFNQSVAGVTKGANAATIGNSSTTSDSTLTITGTSTFAGTIQDVLGSGTMKVNLVVNGGTFTLTGVNTCSGATTIRAGTLALANDAAINLTSGLSIAAGATLDTVALTVPPPSSIPLTASGTGTTLGSTAAAILGVSGLPHDMGSRSIILNYDGANPALYLAGGTMVLNNNPFTINGSILADGVYTIIAQSDVADIAGSVASSTVNGTALTGRTGTVSLSGNTVVLTVSGGGPPQPTIAPVSVSGTNLVVSVPTVSEASYVLQSATNLVPAIHWVNQSTNAGTGGNLILNMPIEPDKPQQFWRFWVY